MTQRHFVSTLHPLSPVIFAAATVVAFVLLCNSWFNFHCYTQREATPTQKSVQKWRWDLSWLIAWKITKGIHLCKPASLNCQIRPTPALSSTWWHERQRLVTIKAALKLTASSTVTLLDDTRDKWLVTIEAAFKLTASLASTLPVYFMRQDANVTVEAVFDSIINSNTASLLDGTWGISLVTMKAALRLTASTLPVYLMTQEENVL